MRTYLSPRMIGAHVLVLVCVAIAGSLGVWQYGAWQAARSAEAADLSRIDPVPLDSVMGPDDPFPGDRVGQPVIIEGSWLPDSTVLVSGRAQDDVDGYWVVTSLTSGASDAAAVPVVRGWTASPDRVPPPPDGPAELVAWLQPGEGAGKVDNDPDDGVLPEMRTADFVQLVDQDLYGAYAVVAGPPDAVAPGDWPVGPAATNAGVEGLQQATLDQLPPVGSFTALRNLLYALEWWVFGGFAAFIWWRFVQETAEEDRAYAGAAGAVADPVPSKP